MTINVTEIEGALFLVVLDTADPVRFATAAQVRGTPQNVARSLAARPLATAWSHTDGPRDGDAARGVTVSCDGRRDEDGNVEVPSVVRDSVLAVLAAVPPGPDLGPAVSLAAKISAAVPPLALTSVLGSGRVQA